MDNILHALSAFTTEYPATTNYILAAAVILQGDLAILFAMLLIVGGALDWGTFASVTLGALTAGELALYLGGRVIRNTRFGWRWYRRMKTSRRIQYYSYYLTQNLTKLLIASRFLVGVNFLVLLLAGWSRTKFFSFLKSYLAGLFIWFITVSTIAYFIMTGLSYLQSERVFRQIEVFIAIVVVLFIVVELAVKRLLKKKIQIETSAERVGRFVEEEMKIPGE